MPPLIIGHRGAAGLEPENTLRSFRRALLIGVDAIETDVRLTRDGTPVCFHDENLERLTGRPDRLDALTIEELGQLEMGQGEPIPTLIEVIRTVKGHAILEIEVKETASVSSIVRTLEDEHVTPSEVIITSFDLLSLQQVRAERPDLRLSVLYRTLTEDWLQAAQCIGARAVNLHFQSVGADWMRTAHEAGLQARTWTVNDAEDMQRLMDMGVDGITTDRPDIMHLALYRNSSRAVP